MSQLQELVGVYEACHKGPFVKQPTVYNKRAFGGHWMAYITLAVTSRVIQQVKETGNPDQRQIAIQGASPELRAAIDTASAKKQVTVAVNGPNPTFVQPGATAK
jgi:hypothetical protein